MSDRSTARLTFRRARCFSRAAGTWSRSALGKSLANLKASAAVLLQTGGRPGVVFRELQTARSVRRAVEEWKQQRKIEQAEIYSSFDGEALGTSSGVAFVDAPRVTRVGRSAARVWEGRPADIAREVFGGCEPRALHQQAGYE